MSVQDTRRANLRAIIEKLKIEGVTDPVLQARALGPSITTARLERMLAGGEVSVLVARAIEHYLRMPRNLMDEFHDGMQSTTPFKT